MCLVLHFMDRWEVRCESWMGPHDASAKELVRVPGEREKIGQKFPKMIPKKEFFLLFSLSEIGSNSRAVFSKVSSQWSSAWLGLFTKPGCWVSPLMFRSYRPYSVACRIHYLLCPESTQVLLFLHQENCPFGQVLSSRALSPRGMSYTFTFFCFSLPGVSFARFTVCYFPKGSKNWRNEGCVNAVVENLRQCSRSNFWISEAWEL